MVIFILCLLIKKPFAPKKNKSFSPVEFSISESLSLDNDRFVENRKIHPHKSINKSKTISLPPLNHEPLIKKAVVLEESGVYRFATSRNVSVQPVSHGTWSSTDNISTWKFNLKSSGARSINLTFSEFNLPEGAALSIANDEDNSRPIVFTARDNDAHGQLWTPLFKTDRLKLKLTVPTHLIAKTVLHLTKINHGFRDAGSGFKISSNTSGSCQIDVICSAKDNSDYGPIIDIYRDQIKSVGAFTLNGIDTCSGALINNTNNDLRPFFLTAEHCGISPSNAASMVVYWNHENSICREVGAFSNGRVGDGPTTQFNTGAILRAEYAPTDFALVELDDPVKPEYSPFFAGWNRSPNSPQLTVGIHHPGISEKRISIDLNPSTITKYLEASQDNEANYLRISEWNFGTTEPGSSGSPLFDDKGNIVGQLTGGYSECWGDNGPDYYGRFYKSWIGGGTQSTRLSDWLDPKGSGGEFIGGIFPNELITIEDASIVEGSSGVSIVEVELKINEVSDGPILVRVRSEDGTATLEDNDYIAVDEIVTFSPGQTTKKIPLTIISDTKVEEKEFLTLNLSDAKKSRASSRPARVEIINDDYIKPEITSTLEFKASTNRKLYYQIEAQNTPTTFSISESPEGMEINSTTGVISWIPPSTGRFAVNIIAANPAGNDSNKLIIIVEPDSLSNALDIQDLPILITNGSPGWRRQINTTRDGSDAARPDPIANNESASFEIEIEGPDLIYYWWKVSSEQDYDFLSISIEGVEHSKISGEIDWQQNTLEIPKGKHLISWTYTKDVNGTGGLDSAWVDQIFLASQSTLPIITSPLRLQVIKNKEVNYRITSIDGSASYSVSALPEGLEFDGIETIKGSPKRSGTFEIMLTAGNGNLFSSSLILEVMEPIDDAIQGLNPLQNIYNFEGGGDDYWIPQKNISDDGIASAQSGPIGDYEKSSMSVNVLGPGTVSFSWKVSSETGYDFLSFNIDETSEKRISGEIDWNDQSFFIPEGEHNLSWVYEKDEGFSEGDDAAWVDNFLFVRKAKPIIIAESNLSFYLRGTIQIPFRVDNISRPIIFENLPSWLSYDPEAQSIIGNPLSPGDYGFKIIAINGDEIIEKEINFSVIWPITEALNDLNWQASGDAIWFPQSDVRFNESPSAQSGKISHRQNSKISLNLRGPAEVSFWWKVSSERQYDYLSVFLDDVILQHRISGEVDWEKRTIDIPSGLHSITWKYSKDVAISSGQDAGWIDKVEILYEGSPEIIIDEQFTFETDDKVEIPFTIGNNPIEIGTENLPDWLIIDQGQGLITGNAPEEGNYSFTLWAENQSGRVIKEIRLDILKPFIANTPSLDWQFSGNSFWFSQQTISHDGESAFQSGKINDDEFSAVGVNLEGPGEMSFWWKVSSEFEYDFLSVRLDGEYIEYISGDVDWEKKLISVPDGIHRFEFVYSKDGSFLDGLDAGWIDEIIYTQDKPIIENIEIVHVSFELIKIGLRINSNFSRARIVQSSDGETWQAVRPLTNPNSDWLIKPIEGWGEFSEFNVPIDPIKNPNLFLRLECE